MRHIFEINNLNLTEFARSFALYKNLGPQAMQSLKHVDLKRDKNADKKRSFKERQRKDNPNEQQKDEEAKMFTKRLLKAQQKEIEKKIDRSQNDFQKGKLINNLQQLKREVYVNEDKVALRKKNFEKARFSVGKKIMDEFS